MITRFLVSFAAGWRRRLDRVIPAQAGSLALLLLISRLRIKVLIMVQQAVFTS